MTTVVWSPPGATYSCNSGDAAWSSDTVVSLAAYQSSCTRNCASGTVLDVLHDGCTIDDIKVEFTGAKNSFGTNIVASADFAGISAFANPLTGSSTLYSANGGAGTLPGVVRAALMTSFCRNDDTTYSASVSMSLPIVTVTYTDRGMPYMLQFSL